MERFSLGVVVGSARQALAIFIVLVTVALTAFLVSHKLSNPDHYQVGGCPFPVTIVHGPIQGFSCRPPSRAAWQIPLAIVIALGGLGAAAALTSRRSWRHAGGPEERRVLRV
jgi:hypothetical protein